MADRTRLGQKKYTPVFNANREDPDGPFVILHRPLIRAYQLKSMDVSAEIEEARAPDDAPRRESVAALKRVSALNDAFIDEALDAHVIGAENLTEGGKPMDRVGVLAMLKEFPELGTEVYNAIFNSGNLTEADAGN